MAQRIGIYSGTFDPIHEGHIAFALAAQQTCTLDEVIVIPEPEPRGKTEISALSHRIAMATQAANSHSGLRALTLRSSRFTIDDTLPELRSLFPGAELSLLIGSDIARHLHTWRGLDRLVGVQFIVGLRQHDTEKSLDLMMRAALDPYGIKFIILPAKMATAHTSSSTARGGDVSHLPEAVQRYIQQNRLYTNS